MHQFRYMVLLCALLSFGMLQAEFIQTQAEETPPLIDGQFTREVISSRNFFTARERFNNRNDLSEFSRYLILAHFATFSNQLDDAERYLQMSKKSWQEQDGPDDFLLTSSLVEYRLLERQEKFKQLLESEQKFPKGMFLPARKSWFEVVSKADEVFPSVSSLQHPVANLVDDDERVGIEVNFGDKTTQMIIDTGAAPTVLYTNDNDPVSLIRTGTRLPLGRASGQGLAEVAILNEMDIAGNVFINTPIYLPDQDNNSRRNANSRESVGFLGFRELSRMGGLTLEVHGESVSNVIFGTSELGSRPNGHPNMYIQNLKPYIRTRIGTETYSCLFDTGAGFSVIGSQIFTTHKKEQSWRKRRNQRIGTLHFQAGERDIRVSSVRLFEHVAPDFCVIGLDAVIAAGGVQLDFVTPHIRFPEP